MLEREAIVFGGAGFIGSHMIDALVASERYSRVVCVDLNRPRFRNDNCEYVLFDVRKEIPIALATPRVTLEIFNFAAVHTTPGHEDWEYFDTNIMGAVRICRFAKAVNCKSLIFTSSISVYGPNEDLIDEGGVPTPTSAYGRSKLAAEQIHQLWQFEGEERRLTIVRPAVIYGLSEHGNFTRLSRLLARQVFVYPGRTDTIKSCGYVKDLIRSMFFMSARNKGQLIYNFCYKERYSISDICRAFSEAAGYSIPKFVFPIWLMNAAAFPFEVLQRLGLRTGINRERLKKLRLSTNIFPRQLIDQDFEFQFDLSSSLRDWKKSSTKTDFD
jgi:nucleoside-diphosphate-sugar epimerase